MSRHFNHNNDSKTRYRMWKSGKKWLFGATVIAASFLLGQVQTLAEEGGEHSNIEMVPSEQPSLLPESHNPVGPQVSDAAPTEQVDPGLVAPTDKQDFSAVDQLTAEQVVNSTQEVRIHYTPNKGDESTYYAWVWGDNDTHNEKGRFLPMQKDENGRSSLSVKPEGNRTSFQYILTNGDNWDTNQKVSGDGDMVAAVNNVTATDIYHGADGWYSQFQNVQTPEFDRKFGYTDKIVTATGFQTVGSNGNLGATLHEDGTATLNLWAPTAKEVKVNIYNSHLEDATLLKSLEMKRGTVYSPKDHTKNTVGLWSITLTPETIGSGLRPSQISYDYQLTIPKAYFIQKRENWQENPPGSGKWENVGDVYSNSATASSQSPEQITSNSSKADIAKVYSGQDQVVVTQDPYSQATVKNGKRTVIVDPSKVGKKVTTSKNVRVDSSTKLSVLEVDIRDFSIDPNSGVSEANKGNYLGFVEEGTVNSKGHRTGIDYLKYLGANYIQMMPIYDFQTVPELPKHDSRNNQISKAFSADDQQNWGYDPKNYNVPEGSYSTDPDDPTNRIEEVKTMVQKLHDAGINIIMDVVYNHLYDGQNNPFEYTVPGYYYAVNGDGKMNNDIGVGNAVRTNSEMMRQYIVNSVAYWALEYGMDGFRFDAMSDLDTNTMNAIRSAINKIDKRIVTYGEGWDSMGKYLAKDGDHPASVSNARLTPEVGFFDSVGRDAIAGSHYDHGNPAGFVNRDSAFIRESGKVTVLADSLMGGHGRSFLNASQQLNYVEVHDGMTLSDLLKHYNPSDSPSEHLNRVELATAMSALSQGIHFSQHGQEFLRTKNHSHNTYNAGDLLNKIDWDLISTNADAVNFTKSLISLRQNEPLWHLSDYQTEVFKHMRITNAQAGSGIITYELKQENGDKYLVIFNNNTAPEHNHSLTLGGSSWYYGEEKSRGEINPTNDFTNAFVVTTNSKNLYNKIGKINGEKTITLDKLTATVLYIPQVEKTSQENLVQTIRYVNKQGESVFDDAIQTVTKVVIEQTDPNLKFRYATSGIGAADASVLGYTENVLQTVSTENVKRLTTYYATDHNGKPTIFEGTIQLDDTGKPIDTATVKWSQGMNIQFSAIPHPTIDNYSVVDTTDLHKDMEKVAAQVVDNRTITVTYAKQLAAYLVSNNDPEQTIPSTKEVAEHSPVYSFKGLEGKTVHFAVDLARQGYTYTVNGYSSLEEALQATGQQNPELTTIYTVDYSPNAATVTVVYVDVDNNIEVSRQSIQGKTDQPVSFTPVIPEGYLHESDNRLEVATFDKLDDSLAASQTITVRLRKQQLTSKLTRVYTISYTGADTPIEDVVVEVIWNVVHDRVTGKKTYTPEKMYDFISKKIIGYRPDKEGFSILDIPIETEPQNQHVFVTYTKVEKPSEAFTTLITYDIDGEMATQLPENPNLKWQKAEIIKEGQNAVYSWDSTRYVWLEAKPSVNQEERHYYKTVIPAMKLENTAKTVIPAIKLEDTAKTVIPAIKLEDTAKTVIPAIKLENTAKTVVPAMKLENTAKTVIPAMKLENTAKTVIPAMKLENTAKTVIPAMKLENTAKTVIPAIKLENTANIQKHPDTAPTLPDAPKASLDMLSAENRKEEKEGTKGHEKGHVTLPASNTIVQQDARAEQKQLPNTGSEDTLIHLGFWGIGTGLLLSSYKKRKEESK